MTDGVSTAAEDFGDARGREARDTSADHYDLRLFFADLGTVTTCHDVD